MNPDSPRPPREELEARLTALLLGELPDEEAAALRELIAKDAQLAELHERLVEGGSALFTMLDILKLEPALVRIGAAR